MLNKQGIMSRCFAFALLCLYIHGGHSLTEEQQARPGSHQVPAQYHQVGSTRSPAVRWTRTQASRSPAPPALSSANITEFKELMHSLHDRVSVLATLDEDLRNRLESIENKIIQFETNNLVRLDSLTAEQISMQHKIDNMTALETATLKVLGELKDDDAKQTDELEVLAQRNENSLNRVTRQYIPPPTAASANSQESLDVISQRLESLATLLVSAREGISSLKNQVARNVSRILQNTSNVQRRLNVLTRRLQQQPPFAAGVLQPNVYAAEGGGSPSALVSSCVNAEPSLDGIMRFKLTPASEPFYVLCEDVPGSPGNDWTVIQQRLNGDINFNRGWEDYRVGFGNIAGEYFIGLEKLHALTTFALQELLVIMEDHEGVVRFARYSSFAIGGENEKYALNVLGTYSGTAGDSLSYHAGYKFSTFDNDNDGCPDCNCALTHLGGWWYNWCDQSNLNGKYHNANETVPLYQGIYWYTFNGSSSSLKRSQIAIRPVDAFKEDQSQRR